jgi:uncharacterized membrane protein YdjX (TVP38/TMEM64 family)
VTKSPAFQRVANLLVILIVVTGIALFFELHLDRYLSMASIKDHEDWLHASYRDHTFATIAAYFFGSILFVLCALPGAALIMLLAGAIFGPIIGTVICSFAVSIGAVLSLLSSRFLFRGVIRRRFARQTAIVKREYRKNGSDYLIAMRLIPIFPYFITNLVFGITDIKPMRFWATSILSSLPGIFIYANAGSELSKINDLGEIFTLRLMLAFAALAALPFVGRFVTKKFLRVRKSPEALVKEASVTGPESSQRP